MKTPDLPRIELEKMLSGELYIGADPLLTAMRQQARKLCRKINASTPKKVHKLIPRLLGSIGPNYEVTPSFICDYGVHIFIGTHFYCNFNCIILDSAKVTIGSHVMLGPNVQIYTAYHPLLASERIKGPELAAPITIGDKVWIGGGAIICQNVTIGNNTTIGAGSVVVKDIPANVFAAGNPCKVIKHL